MFDGCGLNSISSWTSYNALAITIITEKIKNDIAKLLSWTDNGGLQIPKYSYAVIQATYHILSEIIMKYSRCIWNWTERQNRKGEEGIKPNKQKRYTEIPVAW